MALFDDDPRQKRPVHEIGQDLAALSVGDLEERIAQLRAEITRLEAEMQTKSATRMAADSFFKL